jgi:hypothetical protein
VAAQEIGGLRSDLVVAHMRIMPDYHPIVACPVAT